MQPKLGLNPKNPASQPSKLVRSSFSYTIVTADERHMVGGRIRLSSAEAHLILLQLIIKHQYSFPS